MKERFSFNSFYPSCKIAYSFVLCHDINDMLILQKYWYCCLGIAQISCLVPLWQSTVSVNNLYYLIRLLSFFPGCVIYSPFVVLSPLVILSNFFHFLTHYYLLTFYVIYAPYKCTSFTHHTHNSYSRLIKHRLFEPIRHSTHQASLATVPFSCWGIEA